MSHRSAKKVLLIIVCTLLASGCQELSVDVEPAASPSAPAAPSTPVLTTMPASQATVVQPTATAKPTADPNHLQPGTPVRIAALHMADANQGWGIGNRGLGLQDAVLRTADGGLTWQDVTPPLPIADSSNGRQAAGAFTDARHAWVTYADQISSPATPSAEVWYTSDGGASWLSSQLELRDVQVEGYTPDLFGFLDMQHGWLLAHVGAGMNHDYVVIFTTADGGKTWVRVVDPEKNNLAMSCRKTGLVFQTAAVGYLSGDCMGVASGIYLLRTVDGGASWQDVSLQPPADRPDLFTNQNVMCGIDTVMFPSPQEAFIPVRCSTMGSTTDVRRWLYASHDGGRTFQPLPVPAQYGKFDFLNPKTGWLIGSFAPDATRFTLFKTEDGGETWKALANLGWQGTPDFPDEQNGWVVALSGDASALVHSTDGGATWQEIKPSIAGS